MKKSTSGTGKTTCGFLYAHPASEYNPSTSSFYTTTVLIMQVLNHPVIIILEKRKKKPESDTFLKAAQ